VLISVRDGDKVFRCIASGLKAASKLTASIVCQLVDCVAIAAEVAGDFVLRHALDLSQKCGSLPVGQVILKVLRKV
jgi:hypothetical protein